MFQMLEVKLEQTQTFVLDFSSRKCQPCFTLSPVTRSSATGGGVGIGLPRQPNKRRHWLPPAVGPL